MSTETVLLTPNTRNNLRPRPGPLADMQAVSTDISFESVANNSVNERAAPVNGAALESVSMLDPSSGGNTGQTMTTRRGPAPTLHDPHGVVAMIPTVSTRGRGLPSEIETGGEELFVDPALKFPPRATNEAIAVNKLCYLSHPNGGDNVVAEGKTGGSWKARAQKFGHLCNNGEKMVQIHRVLIPNLPLLHIESRQPFRTIDDALVKPTGSNVFVKWDTRYLHKKT
ncbi:hypothetical protein M758_UG290800 [Ceratodon purpureus]|nr:hypothetical protein M758_UG290800 [Ceratodon purpureus]